MPAARSFMVAGVRSKVGKTVVAAALLYALKGRGLHPLVMKPMSVGTVGADGLWRSLELETLAAVNAFPMPLRALCPFRLTQAAGTHDVKLPQSFVVDVVDAFDVLATWADLVVVEDSNLPVGHSPTTFRSVEVAMALRVPVVLVVALEPEAEDSTAQVVESFASHHIPMAGWIANRLTNDLLNPRALVQRLGNRVGAPCLGSVPWLADPEPNRVAQSLDVDRLLARVCLADDALLPSAQSWR